MRNGGGVEVWRHEGMKAWGAWAPGRHETWSDLREASGASHASKESGDCGRSAKRLQKC